MDAIGLVFAGGGGKGAYQIGVWRAVRELQLEQYIAVVAGTSVGALNGALFLKGDLAFAEQLWGSISTAELLPIEQFADDSLFSNDGLQSFVHRVVMTPDRADAPVCYSTCKKLNDGTLRYYDITHMIDPSYRKRVLLASSALPGIYPLVEIDGEMFVDGGANGDNVPVYPVYHEGMRQIIVVHLSQSDAPENGRWDGADIYDIYPSEDLGGFLTGTVDFSPERAGERMTIGYRDAMAALRPLSACFQQDWEEEPLLDTITPDEKTEVPQNDKGEKQPVKKIEFEQEQVREQYEARLAELKKIADSPRLNGEVMWDATAQKYSDVVNRVSAMLQQAELKDEVSERLTKQLNAFLKKCEKPEFHIALVGAIKAGKSSLINAILGEELASTEVTPETAALTKFRGSRTTDQIMITFYSAADWDKLWHSVQDAGSSKFLEEFEALHAAQEKDNWVGHEPVVIESGSREELKEEIRKWTSSRSATHYFVKEVEVALKDLPLPEGVVLVDTPGLNDAVEYRSNITKDYIDRANAVFVCVKADRLSGQELATIYGVFSNARYNPEKIYIIATQQDSLNNPVGDWSKQRLVWLDFLKEPACYGEQALAERNLISTSGYFYTLLHDMEHLSMDRQYQLFASAMKFQCMPDKITEHYDELLDFTGIDHLKRRMDSEILEKYRELLREDIKNGYTQVKDRVGTLMEQVRSRQKEIIEMASKDIEEIRRKEAENEKKLREAENEQKELDELYKTIKKSTSQQKKQVAEAIRALGGRR